MTLNELVKLTMLWTTGPRYLIWNGLCHAKKCLWTYTDSKGPNHPMNLGSLIRAFTVHWRNHWILQNVWMRAKALMILYTCPRWSESVDFAYAWRNVFACCGPNNVLPTTCHITLHLFHVYVYCIGNMEEKNPKMPVFLFYRNGKVKYKYGGENSKDGIIKWLRKWVSFFIWCFLLDTCVYLVCCHKLKKKKKTYSTKCVWFKNLLFTQIILYSIIIRRLNEEK